MSNEQTIQPLHLNIPEVIDANIPVIPFGKRSNAEETIAALLAGEYVLISNLFSDGLSLLKSLKYYLKKKASRRDLS